MSTRITTQQLADLKAALSKPSEPLDLSRVLPDKLSPEQAAGVAEVLGEWIAAERIGESAAELARLRGLVLAERSRYAEAEALLVMARDHAGPRLSRSIAETLERHKRERTASRGAE